MEAACFITKLELKGKMFRFLRHWFGFALYVVACAHLFIFLERDQQASRQDMRDARRWYLNQSLSVMLFGNEKRAGQSDDRAHVIDDLLEAATLMVESKRDQSWDLVNSLYYCSSLYTTVGKVAFSIAAAAA